MKKATIALLLICGAVFAQQKGSFTDTRDKKTYKTVKIGEQTWMAKNLNYDAKGSKCYDNKPANCEKYGRLYDWETALKACPYGWHLPDNDEWDVLIAIVGGKEVAGKKLKAKSGWKDNGNGTDEFGFSALPSGYGSSDGYFTNVGYRGSHWWSASKSEYRSNDAYTQNLYCCDDGAIGGLSYYKSRLFSVRCVQDSVAVYAQAPSPEIAELEQEAKKYVEEGYDRYDEAMKKEGRFFSFKEEGSAEDIGQDGLSYYRANYTWKATSKVKIGNCPAKSVWEMHTYVDRHGVEGESKVPPKCESITPKVITDYQPE